jgi:hypothetical protein
VVIDKRAPNWKRLKIRTFLSFDGPPILGNSNTNVLDFGLKNKQVLMVGPFIADDSNGSSNNSNSVTIIPCRLTKMGIKMKENPH